MLEHEWDEWGANDTNAFSTVNRKLQTVDQCPETAEAAEDRGGTATKKDKKQWEPLISRITRIR